MKNKVFAIFAAGLLVTACQTTTDNTGSVDGDGSTLTNSDLEILGQPTGSIDAAALNGAPQPTLTYLTQTYGDRVLFNYDSTTLTPQGQQIVKGWSDWMLGFSDLAVRIEGHCDERGTREYNLALGDKRANTIRSLMIAYGVDPSRIDIVSFGKERPVIAGHTDESWAENRRGVLTII
jgi:peptidoglycan-associated lipoprotein